MSAVRGVNIWSPLLAGVLAACAAATPPPAARLARASSPPTNVRVLRSARPAYPADLVLLGVHGRVTIDCIISEQGVPEDCTVTKSTDHRFDRSALAAEAAALYTPALRDGVPVRVHHVVNITYAEAAAPWRTDVRLNCRISPAGHADACRMTSLTGLAAVGALMTHLVERVRHAPSIRHGVAVVDPGRSIELAVLARRVLRASDLALAPIPGARAHVELFLSCDPRARRACAAVRHDEAAWLLASRPDPASPELFAMEVGIMAVSSDITVSCPGSSRTCA